MKVVIVGAHPDDPETACGGTIALLAQAGHEVVVAYLTSGEAAEVRTQEALRACEILGARAVFLNQIDGQSEVNNARYEEMSCFLFQEKPDILFTHWSIDSHRDHRNCSSLVYDAWMRLGRQVALFYFEPMTGQQSQNFAPSDYVDVTPVLERKHEACFVHESQHVRDWYEQVHGRMEVFRGMESGYKFAEAFVRHIQSADVSLTILRENCA